MKDIFVLTKVLLKNSFGRNSIEKKSNISRISVGILIMAGLVYIIGILGYFSYGIINMLIEVNQEQLFISLSLLLLCSLILIRTIFTSINVLYFSKDIEFLLPLPISPKKIVFAKFNVMLVSSYITELVFLSVPYIIYWYMLKLPITFLLYSLLVFLVIPVIPMLVASIIIVFIMSFTSVLKNKDVVQYISAILTVILIVGIQFINTSSNKVSSFVLANKILEINGYSKIITDKAFIIKQAVNVLILLDNFEVIKNLVLLYFENVFLYIFVVLIISKMYLKSALKITGAGNKILKVKINKLSRKGVGKSYILKEFNNLFRTPIFLFQCVLPSFIFPVILLIPLYRELNAITLYGITINDFSGTIEELLNSGFGFGLVLALINIFYIFNFISITSISREGTDALFMKYIPISLRRQFKYKTIPGVVINIFPLIVILGVLKSIFSGLSWILLLKIFLCGVLTNFVVNYFSVAIDVLRPKLYWTSEYTVVKQNFNMIYGIVINLVIIGVIVSISSYIESVNLIILLLSIVFVGAILVFEIFLKKYENLFFKRIS